MRYALLAVLVVLALPCSVQARPFNAEERAALRVAQSYWGWTPAKCPIRYVAESLGGGKGWWWRCEIHIEQAMSWVEKCNTITHELGHAIQEAEGRPVAHTPGMGDIMSESPNTTYACDRADDRRTYRRLAAKCSRKSGAKRRRCIRRARSAVYDY